MDPKIYKLHKENEQEHWWYKGRREILSSIISNFIYKDKKIKILDFGAGSGTNISMLTDYGEVHVYEKDKNTVSYLKKKFENFSNVFVLDELDENVLFDLVIASDVIEHIENDSEIIKTLSKSLKINGNILITVPAFNSLYTERDKILGHYRRYNYRTIKQITKNNFQIIKLSYYNFFLFFLSLLLLVLIKVFKVKSLIFSPEKTPNTFLNNIFYKIFSFEKFLLKYINFPFGVSIIYLAKKINK